MTTRCTRHCGGSIANAPVHEPCLDCWNEAIADARLAAFNEAIEIVKETAKDVWTQGTAGYPELIKRLEKARGE